MPSKKTPNSAEAREMLAMSQGLGLDDRLVQMLKLRSRGASLAEISKTFKLTGNRTAQILVEPFSRFRWLKTHPPTPEVDVITAETKRAICGTIEALEEAGERIRQSKEELECVMRSAGKGAAREEKLLGHPELSARVHSALEKAKIKKVSELMRRTPGELRKYKDFGISSVREVRGFLTKRGLGLKGDKRHPPRRKR